ncbi:ABC transporter ATP-binding protein [Paraoerskovia sediminicola]|uniref:ABC transporter ATP-binding protein n=1 Tax=Paraoerskovia sediminicola TaxID=1138587 RepID=A0ABN6XB01_9CELL|nr:ABC transporter ATP-binding protein [Paraoerskovia sediminicola]BDZ40950.1 ABC transporter ATP-binding protein [Paraoerskovia sediminicola]
MSETNDTNTTPQADAPREDQQPLLAVRDLEVSFTTAAGEVKAVKGIDLTVYPGQTVAIVGESGSGKSTSAHAVINLLPGTGKVTGGTITFDGKDITKGSTKDYVALRGRRIGLVPQDPMSNLNPVWRIGYQIKEALTANGVSSTRAERQSLTSGIVADELLSDDDLYLSSEAKKKLLAELRTALGGRDGADDAVARADEQLAVGSSTRADARRVLDEAGLPDADARTAAVVKGGSMNDRVAGLLSEAGLQDAERRARQYPHEFSGGMRQRALIAIGLAARPQLLIADEPTSALDVTVQRTILDHLGELTKELGTAVLFITHDLGLAAERAEHLVVMYQGKVVESGPARQILESPKHAYTKRLVASAPSLASRRIQSARAAGVDTEETRALHHGNERADDVIVAENLTKVFRLRGSRPGSHTDFTAVDDVSFRLPRGTTLALVGESGSGKSTAANMVLNLLEPTKGKIIFDGVDLTALNKKELFKFRRRVQPIFQNPYGSLDPMFSIFRSIEEPLRVHKVGNKKSREKRVRELLDMVSLPQATMRRFPNELSGGQRQRIAIARALALEPEVIVCDEAVSALDVLVQAQILTLLNDLQAELGLSYLFITHDLAVVRQIADHVCVMQQGKIVEQASTDDVFENPQQEYTKELLAAIPGATLTLGAGSQSGS